MITKTGKIVGLAVRKKFLLDNSCEQWNCFKKFYAFYLRTVKLKLPFLEEFKVQCITSYITYIRQVMSPVRRLYAILSICALYVRVLCLCVFIFSCFPYLLIFVHTQLYVLHVNFQYQAMITRFLP